ncbi:MAG: response regulator transcription factor [Candidatus Niameybacter stercoravium]|nr:response regulator transcription factor [Candidatus Niameybacter stercoravium]
MYNILVVDDEKEITDMLKDYLEGQSYLVYTAHHATEAIEKLNVHPDLILLDVMMPDVSGYELCLQIRDKVQCPILFLTAKVGQEDIIRGLELGGDDYLIKPFRLKELKARIDSHLRREERRTDRKKSILYHKNCMIDLKSESVSIKGQDLHVTKKEFELISFLAMNKGQTFSKEQMYERLWGYDVEGESRTITEHIKNIRKKMQEAGETEEYIKTVWGIGYRWE